MRRALETTAWSLRKCKYQAQSEFIPKCSVNKPLYLINRGSRYSSSFTELRRLPSEGQVVKNRGSSPYRTTKQSQPPILVVNLVDGNGGLNRLPTKSNDNSRSSQSYRSQVNNSSCPRKQLSSKPSLNAIRQDSSPQSIKDVTKRVYAHYDNRNGSQSKQTFTPGEKSKAKSTVNTRPAGRPDETNASQPKTSVSRVKKIKANRKLYIPSMISVTNFARLLGIRQELLQRHMESAGMENSISYDHILMTEDASLLAMEFGFDPIVDDEAGFDIFPSPSHPNPQSLLSRPPIVTIMGHVDHGKTTLLDKLRSSSVAKGEAGGITQHIGAFSVPVNLAGEGKNKDFITFLDTPGHAAFSAMRARGARVTDIVVLVVAADDGVKPQTKEVINLIKQDPKLGVVVAITKCDKPGVDTDSVQRQLLGEGLELEVFGGDIPCVEVSGVTGHGLADLVETISATAEVMEIRSEWDGKTHGYVIESRIQKGLGPVATVLVQRGALRPHSHIICNLTTARVRQMTDAAGKVVKVALPGMAVNVSGWKELPNSGDEVLEGDESEIRKALTNRHKRAEFSSMIHDAEAINERRQLERYKKIQAEQDATHYAKTGLHLASAKQKEVAVKELFLVIKGDVTGSVEAVEGALVGIGNHLAKVKVVSAAVGEVTDSDLSLARAVEGVIVAFNVKTPKNIEIEASSHKIPIISSPIIYRLMEEVKAKVIELLPTIRETKVIGEAKIMQLFDIGIKGRTNKRIAGCRGRNGSLHRNQLIRVIRQGECIHEGPVDALKHHKTDIQEVSREMDFGLSLQNFEDIRIGDLLQSIKHIEHPGKL